MKMNQNFLKAQSIFHLDFIYRLSEIEDLRGKTKKTFFSFFVFLFSSCYSLCFFFSFFLQKQIKLLAVSQDAQREG